MEFLHLAYKIPPIYEKLRKKLIDDGEFGALIDTYCNQRIFFPDENSGNFWDDVFLIKDKLMPMEVWRIGKVISLINGKKSVLNIGVGKGSLEKYLFRKFPRINYHGTDITNIALRELKKNYGSKNFSYQPFPKLNFASSSFDQILLLEVLEHVKPSVTFAILSEIFRIIKPDGLLIISVPINENLEKLLPYNPNSHMRIYSEELIKTELRISGFSIEKIYRASAFHRFFNLKQIVNQILKIREYNNLILLARKK